MIFFNHSILSIILTIVILTSLFFLFSFLNKYIPLFYKKNNRKNFTQYLYSAEIIIGLTVGIIILGYLYQKSVFAAWMLTLFLLIILIFISLYFLKDYIAGLFIKSSGEYRKEDYIKLAGEAGKIERLAKTQMILTDNKGDKIYIPYSKVITQIKKIQTQTNHTLSNITFAVSIFKEEINILELKKFIVLLPWVHNSYEPDLQIQKESKELLINLYTFDKKYKRQIKKAIEEKLKTV